MIKKKGFTLVELLAVIVILAVILAIAIPSVSNIIDGARLNAYTSNEKMVVKAAKNLVMLDETRLPATIGGAVTINISELQTNSLISEIKDLKDKSITCDGYVLIRKMAATIYDYRPYIKCGNNYRSEGLIAWYSFEGNTNDISGSAYNGTATSITYPLDGLYNVGSFSGTSLMSVPNFYNSGSTNPVFLGTSPSSADNYNGNATYSAWVKPTTVDTTTRYVFSDSNYNEGLISFNSSSIYGSWSSSSSATYSTTVLPNTWYYVTATHERNNASNLFIYKLYVNGVLRGTGTLSIPSSATTYGPDANLTVGYNWIGSIEDIRIHNKVLTVEEILNNYNTEKLRFGL